MTENKTAKAKTIPLYKSNRLPKRKLSANGIKGKRLINQYTAIAAGAGVVPIPLFGQMAVAGLLGKLLTDLCKLYGVSFSDHQIKITISAILGGAHVEWLNHYLMKYIRGYTPVLRTPGDLVLRPAISAMLVYYLGQMFLGHLESGSWVRVKEQGLQQFR